MSLFTGGLRRAAERGRREIAHNAITPAFLGNATQRSLQTVITTEKDLIKRSTALASEFQKNLDALRTWGGEQERDLGDVLSKWASLLEAFPNALESLNQHLQINVRPDYKRIRTKEEQLIDLKAKFRNLTARIESVEKKLAKMGPENKELPKTTQLLSDLRTESSAMQLQLAQDSASLEDFKRSAMHSALGNKAAALMQLANHTAIMAQFAAGMLDELQTDPCPAGSDRPDYKGSRRTENLLQTARLEMQKIPYQVPHPPDEDCSPRLPGVHGGETSIRRENSLGYPTAPPGPNAPTTQPIQTDAALTDFSSPRSPSITSPAHDSERGVGLGRAGSFASVHSPQPEHRTSSPIPADAQGTDSHNLSSLETDASRNAHSSDEPHEPKSAVSPRLDLAHGELPRSDSNWGQEALAAVHNTSRPSEGHPPTIPEALTDEYLSRPAELENQVTLPTEGAPAETATHNNYDAYDAYEAYDSPSAHQASAERELVPEESAGSAHVPPVPVSTAPSLANPYPDESEAAHSPRDSIASADVPSFAYNGPLRVVNTEGEHGLDHDDFDARSQVELPAYTPQAEHNDLPPVQTSIPPVQVDSNTATSPVPMISPIASASAPATAAVPTPAPESVGTSWDASARQDDFVGSTRAAQAAVRRPVGGYDGARDSSHLAYGGDGDLPAAPSPAPNKKIITAGAFRRNFFRKASAEVAPPAPPPPVSQVAAAAPASPPEHPQPAYGSVAPLQINKRSSHPAPTETGAPPSPSAAHPQGPQSLQGTLPPPPTAAAYRPYSPLTQPPQSGTPRPPGAYAPPSYGYGQQYSDPYAGQYSQGQYSNPYGP